MNSSTKRRIREAIEKLLDSGDIERLKAHPNEYRLRVGGWRILFEKKGDDLIINVVLPRGVAYKDWREDEMAITIEQLRELLDNMDQSQYRAAYDSLSKLTNESGLSLLEKLALRRSKRSIARGEFYTMDEIDWK